SSTATYKNPVATHDYQDPGCFSTFYNVAYSNPSMVNDREAVLNLHFGIPHKNDAGKDDVQVLYTNSSEYRQYYSSVDDAGAPLVNGLVQQDDLPEGPHWPDYYTFPSGTQFLANAWTTHKIAYFFPGSPTNRCANISLIPGVSCKPGDLVALPNDYRDGRWDTASIVKLQYQKNFGSNAYLRVFGYTFYSNTNRSGATRRGIGSGFGAQNYDYEVDGHTHGFQADFGDQINSANLISASVNYVKSDAYRINNYNYDNTAYTQISNLTDGTDCYYHGGPRVGQRGPCNDTATQGTFIFPTAGLPENPCGVKPQFNGTPACAAGATFRLTYTGNQALINGVTPAFTNLALGDEWRPNDKLDINVALKYANDNFYLQNTNDPGKNFWFRAAQQEFCYNPKTDQPVLVPQPPQDASTVEPYVNLTCPVDKSSGTPVQTVHPDGKSGHLLLSNVYPSTYVQNYWQPRIGMTFTANPDTVFRISAGRYAQEPQNYEIQYNSLEQNLAAQLIGFLPYGFTTPFHDAQAQFSDNYDLSYERHFKGTDMSIKVTPYYRYATQQLDEAVYIPTLLASPAINAGTESSKGVELEFTKGDFNRNGLAAIFSYTYLYSVEKWNNFQGITQNAVDPYNQYIQEYNALTKAGGGAQCYKPTANATAAPNCNSPYAIRNPYYDMAPQPLLDKFGWYATGLDYPYTSPNVFSMVLNYKHNRFAITPAFTLNEGATYGSSADVIGIDPRTCERNQLQSGIPNAYPRNADYTSCGFAATPTGNLYIPNPQTGKFDSFGEYRQPWQFNMGLSLHYDVSPRVTVNAIVANLVNACFGGSAEPWTAAAPPSQYVCGYSPNPFYISNFYNGSSPSDRQANGVPLNPYFASSFSPSYGDNNSFNYPLPLNVYITMQVKL
ncbi:MAG TPA: TonB-dependent receptor, partial [Candidatus Acidoferrales bacterium]|nr:TonB-dependent receptor [Candidatus Acidoferrales bacterium]